MPNKCSARKCPNFTSESKILPGHWLAYCDVHIGEPCAIEDCRVRQEWFRVNLDDGMLDVFYDDEHDPSLAVKSPYCWEHGSLLNNEWTCCEEPGCVTFAASPHTFCSVHGGQTLVPRAKMP